MRIIQHIFKLGFLIALLLLPFCSSSQEHYVGARGGYSISSIGFDPYKGETMSVSGLDFGVAYKLYAEKYMGTQIEFNRVQKGYKLTTITTKEDGSIDTTRNTTATGYAVELPMMAQGFVRFGGFRVLLNAGVFGSYMLSQEREIEEETGAGVQVNMVDGFNDRDKRFEYGVLFGGGFAFQLKKIELQLEVRYQYSLGYAIKPRYKDEQTLFANRSHLAFSATLFYNL